MLSYLFDDPNDLIVKHENPGGGHSCHGCDHSAGPRIPHCPIERVPKRATDPENLFVMAVDHPRSGLIEHVS
jgi:hypothetical protein